jgi:hypothetical protein
MRQHCTKQLIYYIFLYFCVVFCCVQTCRASCWHDPFLLPCLAGQPGTISGPKGHAWANVQARGLFRHGPLSTKYRAGPFTVGPCLTGPVPGRPVGHLYLLAIGLVGNSIWLSYTTGSWLATPSSCSTSGLVSNSASPCCSAGRLVGNSTLLRCSAGGLVGNSALSSCLSGGLVDDFASLICLAGVLVG